MLTVLDQGFSAGVPRDVMIEKNKHRFLNLLAKINRSTKKLSRTRTLNIMLRCCDYRWPVLTPGSRKWFRSTDNYYWIIISTTY
jgi:hypothetical protein